jgi:hypothetical protein
MITGHQEWGRDSAVLSYITCNAIMLYMRLCVVVILVAGVGGNCQLGNARVVVLATSWLQESDVWDRIGITLHCAVQLAGGVV